MAVIAERLAALPTDVRVGLLLAMWAVLLAMMLWIISDSLVPLARAIAANAPVVTFAPEDARAVPLAMVMLIAATFFVMPTRDVGLTGRTPRAGTAKRRRCDRFSRIAAGVMIAMLGLLGLSFLAPPIALAVVDDAVAARGYTGCPDVSSLRHPRYSWVRSRAREPSSGCPYAAN